MHAGGAQAALRRARTAGNSPAAAAHPWRSASRACRRAGRCRRERDAKVAAKARVGRRGRDRRTADGDACASQALSAASLTSSDMMGDCRQAIATMRQDAVHDRRQGQPDAGQTGDRIRMAAWQAMSRMRHFSILPDHASHASTSAHRCVRPACPLAFACGNAPAPERARRRPSTIAEPPARLKAVAGAGAAAAEAPAATGSSDVPPRRGCRDGVVRRRRRRHLPARRPPRRRSQKWIEASGKVELRTRRETVLADWLRTTSPATRSGARATSRCAAASTGSPVPRSSSSATPRPATSRARVSHRRERVARRRQGDPLRRPEH